MLSVFRFPVNTYLHNFKKHDGLEKTVMDGILTGKEREASHICALKCNDVPLIRLNLFILINYLIIIDILLLAVLT